MSKNKIKIHLPELDFLRGLAALFMVVNHIGNNLLNEAIKLPNFHTSILLLLTSFAPVLFFLSSGIGAGIQSVTKSNHLQLKSTLYKFALLMVADAFFAWGSGKLWGFDFLGYIAVIVILIELVRCSKFAKTICVLGIILIFVVRFIVGPQIDLTGGSFGLNAATWLVGFRGISGSAYPFSPWFTYPLIGFILGALIARNHQAILAKSLRNNTMLLISAALFSAFSYYLSTRGYLFFRWGTVSFGFYCLSFAVIPLSIMTVYNLHHLQLQKQLKLFYLSGTASLAIVPIHYYLISLAKSINVSPMSGTYTYPLLLLLILLASFILAKLMDTVTKKMQSYANSQYIVPGTWIVITILAATTYGLSTSVPDIAKFTQALGQLTVCVLFSLRVSKKGN